MTPSAFILPESPIMIHEDVQKAAENFSNNQYQMTLVAAERAREIQKKKHFDIRSQRAVLSMDEKMNRLLAGRHASQAVIECQDSKFDKKKYFQMIHDNVSAPPKKKLFDYSLYSDVATNSPQFR